MDFCCIRWWLFSHRGFVWARDPALGLRQTRHLRPIEQKENRCWGEELRALNVWREVLPQTELLYVADRESDIDELLAEERTPGVDLLIRAVRNRKTTAGGKLWSEAANRPRPSTPTGAAAGSPAGGLGERTFRPGRTGTGGVDAAHPSAGGRGGDRLASRRVLSAALADRTILSRAQARLPSEGLAVANPRQGGPSRLALAAFSPGDGQTLGQIHQPRLAPEAPDLREATRLLARLGNYTARKRDGPPGPKTFCLGRATPRRFYRRPPTLPASFFSRLE